MQELLFSFMSQWSYLGLIGILLIAGFGAPIPEDVPLLAAGWLVYEGQAELGLMIATALFGVMMGDTIIFTLGRRYGMKILEHRFLKRIAKPWMLEKAQFLYDNHGAKMLFGARFMPGVRAVVYLKAGVFKVPYWKLWLFDGAAALISVPVWVCVGWKFSPYIKQILGGAKIGSYIVGGLAVLAIGIWVWLEYRRKGQRKLAMEAIAAKVRSAPLVTPSPEPVAHESPIATERIEKKEVKVGTATAVAHR